MNNINELKKIMVQADPEVIEITLTPEKFPEAYKRKLEELMEQKAFNTEEEAKEWIRTTPILLELVYEKDSGLFAIESEALETGTCVSPYSSLPVIPEE